MAKTFYKYEKQSVDSFINWAEISRDFSKTLTDEVAAREKKKAEIDENSRKFANELQNAPKGQHEGINKWLTDGVADATELRLTQDRLLKEGKLSLKNYTLARQNLMDGFNITLGLSKEYQDEYAEKMKRINSADPATRSQPLETFFMGTAEGFANFSNSKILVNPTDGSISLGLMKKNEQTGLMELTQDVQPVSVLRNTIKSRFNYFDSKSAITESASKLGQFVTAEIIRGSDTKAGKVITVENAMQRPEFEKQLALTVESYFKNPYNLSSVLTSDISNPKTGEQYQFTYDKKLADSDKNYIYLKVDENSGNPVPQFSKEQEEAVYDFMKGQIKQQITYKKDINPYSEPKRTYAPEYVYQAGSDAKQKDSMVDTWMKVAFGKTETERYNAAQALLGNPYVQNQKIVGIDVIGVSSNPYVEIKYQDSKLNRKIPIKQGTNPLSWASIGSEVTGVDDAASLSRVSSGFKGDAFDIDANVTAERNWKEDVKPETQTDKVRAYTNASSSGLINDESTPKTAENYKRVFGKLGFAFSKNKQGVMSVTAPNGKRIDVDIWETGAEPTINDFIVENQSEKITSEVDLKTGQSNTQGVGAKYNKTDNKTGG